MAARKRSGLGNGLANLIPSNQREVRNSPVDVFFGATGRAGTRTSESVSSEPHGATGSAFGEELAKAEAPTGAQRTSTKKTEAAKQSKGKKSKPERKTDGESAAKTPDTTKDAELAKPAPTETSSKKASVPEKKAAGEGVVKPDGDVEEAKVSSTHAEGDAKGAERANVAGSEQTIATEGDVSRETDSRGSKGVDAGESDVSRETDVHGSKGADAGESNVSRETDKVGSTDEARTDSDTTAGSEQSQDSEDLVAVPGVTYGDLPIDLIVPNTRQPRTVFDEDELQELADSIAEVGVLQPIIVRPLEAQLEDHPEARYELIMGERRWRATRLAGLDTVPAIVRRTADEDLLRDALLENLHRAQLNPLEEAAAYQQLLEDFACTQEELARRIARSRPQISNTLRLLKLPPLVQQRVAAQIISAGHARALLSLPNPVAMEKIAQRIVAENLSVRAVEEIVAMWDEPSEAAKPKKRARVANPALEDLSVRLGDRFETKVKVTMGARKGSIRIDFAGSEDLERILMVLAPGMQGVDAAAAFGSSDADAEAGA